MEETGRAGLAEMRRLIGVLTDDGEAASTAPQPGLAELGPAGRDGARRRPAGRGRPLGQPRELSAGADLAAYRVIQESLTNALKHAGPANARVGSTTRQTAS